MSMLCVMSVSFSVHWTLIIQLLDKVRSYLESSGVKARLVVCVCVCMCVCV
jgi:hypothetical protein